MDEEFLQLTEQKFRARMRGAMKSAITRPKIRIFLEQWWETGIKRSFDGSERSYSQEVPFAFMTTAERRRRLDASAPQVIFTEYVAKSPWFVRGAHLRTRGVSVSIL